MPFSLPDLPYAHDALAPYMSRKTLELHHDKHHQAYVDNGNKLLDSSAIADGDLTTIIQQSYNNPDEAGLFNNASQHLNHVEFWQWMKPGGGGAIPSELEKKLVEDFGSLNQFKQDFINAGLTQFGSGWCWLVLDNGRLQVAKTANGESPMAMGKKAILGCDVWEHSYYVDYSNRRPDYLKSFLDNLVDWERVASLL